MDAKNRILRPGILRLAFSLAVLAGLAACGQDRDATDDGEAAVDETAVTDEATPADEAIDAADGDEATAETPLEVVEESAGDDSSDADEAIVLAQSDIPAPPTDSKFREGTHYVRLVPTQPTVGGADKIEVAEFFWYGCPHCYDFEPVINPWVENRKPASVRFERVPATWNALVRLHAQLYYTEQVLVRSGAITDADGFRGAVFQEYHRRGNRLTSIDAIRALFERHGVSADDFDKAWTSFEVAQRLRVADDLARRYGVSSVPQVIVNGKYRTGAAEAGGHRQLLELIEELIAREAHR